MNTHDSPHWGELYLSPSPHFPEELRTLLQQTNEIIVSGQPLLYWDIDGKEFPTQDAPAVIDARVIVRQVVEQTIPQMGHRHLDPRYIGTYCVLAARNLDTGEEYLLPIVQELGFAATITTDYDATLNKLLQ